MTPVDEKQPTEPMYKKHPVLSWLGGGAIVAIVIFFANQFFTHAISVAHLEERLTSLEKSLVNSDEFSELKNKVTNQAEDLNDLKTEIGKGSHQMAGIENEAGKIDESAKEMIGNVSHRIAELERLVTGMAAKSRDAEKALAEYSQRIGTITNRLQAAPVAPLPNSSVKVTIVFDSSTDELAQRTRDQLASQGFIKAEAITVDQWDSGARIRARAAGRQRLAYKPARAVFVGAYAQDNMTDIQRVLAEVVGNKLKEERVDYGRWPIVDVEADQVLIMLLYPG